MVKYGFHVGKYTSPMDAMGWKVGPGFLGRGQSWKFCLRAQASHGSLGGGYQRGTSRMSLGVWRVRIGYRDGWEGAIETTGDCWFIINLFRGLTTYLYIIYIIYGDGFKHFLFSPLLGEMIQFDEHIFQMGWFNHQLGNHCGFFAKHKKNTGRLIILLDVPFFVWRMYETISIKCTHLTIFVFFIRKR